MGNLKVLPAEPSDAAEILALQFAAFSDQEPFWEVLFPLSEDREHAIQRLLNGWLGDKSVKYVKVMDEESRVIVSAAKWCIYETQFTEEEMSKKIKVDWHSNQDKNEWSEHLIAYVRQNRLKRTKGAPCAVLDIMATHPAHQKRGAGAMAVKWGTDLADSWGMECFIEASPPAKRLYEKCGFIAVPKEYISVPVPEKWKWRPVVGFYFYERPAVGQKGNGEVKES